MCGASSFMAANVPPPAPRATSTARAQDKKWQDLGKSVVADLILPILNAGMTATPSPAAGPVCPSPVPWRQTIQFRVRYSETDQMGTFYNSRPLEWFEMGRTELLRHLGLPYAGLETQGVFLPLVEAGLQYLGRARYDDLLEMTTELRPEGRARVRTDVEIRHAATGAGVVRGHTVHAFANRDGRATRPPAAWLAALSRARQTPAASPAL